MDTFNQRPRRGHALRRGRYSEHGRIYLITTVTNGRAPLFNDLRLARSTIQEMRECDRRGRCHTLAFVLMPDHLHWLLQLEAGCVSRLLERFKAHSAKLINQETVTTGRRVWQAGFHDHALRSDEDLLATARYVVANPVRAGLVSRVGDYPHWDAVWL